MEFILQTPVAIKKPTVKVAPSDNIMMVGSCFTENMGNLMTQGGINTCVNPFGIIYNPKSITETLLLILQRKVFTEKDIFEQDGIFKSYFFHSRHASVDPNECLTQMNQHAHFAANFLHKANQIILTLGTAFAFKLKTTQQMVANCHKTPAINFEKILLTPEEIVAQLSTCIDAIRKINPAISVIFTVSPIRHLRDGLHENQISKSILHYAIYQLRQTIDHIDYFPAYEIMVDELRDYRFYADDMIHPSPLAIQYIWEKFRTAWCTTECNAMIGEMAEIRRAMLHRWQRVSTNQLTHFVNLHLMKIKDMEQKYPHLDVREEYSYFENLLMSINTE